MKFVIVAPDSSGQRLSFDQVKSVQMAILTLRDPSKSIQDKDAAAGFLGGMFGVLVEYVR